MSWARNGTDQLTRRARNTKTHLVGVLMPPSSVASAFSWPIGEQARQWGLSQTLKMAVEWTGRGCISDGHTRAAQLKGQANPPVSRLAHKLCDRSALGGKRHEGSGGPHRAEGCGGVPA